MPQPRFLTMTTWWRKRARPGQALLMQAALLRVVQLENACNTSLIRHACFERAFRLDNWTDIRKSDSIELGPLPALERMDSGLLLSTCFVFACWMSTDLILLSVWLALVSQMPLRRWATTSAWSQPLLRWTVMRTAAGPSPRTRWSWPKTRVRLSPTLLLWRTPKLQFLSMHLVMRICVGWEFLIYFLCWTSSQDISSVWWFVMFFSRTFVPIFVRIKLDRIQCVQSSPCLAPYDRVDLG